MFKASDYTDVLKEIESFLARSTQPHSVLNGECLDEQPSHTQKPSVSRTVPPPISPSGRFSLPAQGKPLSALKEDVAHYLSAAVRTAHPAYFNQLWGGFSPACFIADMVTSAANTSMYTHEVAPIATQIEKALIAKMGQFVGFKRPGGQFTTGGSNGNLMAMAIARHQAIPQIKQTGLANQPQLIALVSQEAHYSFLKAAQLLGLGAQNLWRVPVDECGQLQVNALKQLIARARAQGAQPFFVAGTAGTTVRGAYDPLEEIGAIAREEKLWFHVDGAWGGSALLSIKHRPMMRGVSSADSVVWDAHKMMGMTLMCSVLLTKQRSAMHSAFSVTGTDYLFHDDRVSSTQPEPNKSEPNKSEPNKSELKETEPTDLGPSTLHCGRRVDALKLWLAWQHLGDSGWANLIDRYFELAERAEMIIRAHPNLEMVFPRQSLNVCFRYVSNNVDDTNSNTLTLSIRQRLLAKGLAMVNYATLEEVTFFRLVICNNQTSISDLEKFFRDVVAIGKEIEQEGNFILQEEQDVEQIEKAHVQDKQKNGFSAAERASHN